VTERLFLEDFVVGQTFRAGPYLVTTSAIKRFAAEFDPQPFHLDEAAAATSFFGGLAASGWHTTAITMRLMVEGGVPIAGGIIGAGGEELRWLRPVRPGDALRIESEVLEIRPSRSKPGHGMLKVRVTTFNQNDEPVQTSIGNLIARRRAGHEAGV
jgi:acyl dehydratase